MNFRPTKIKAILAIIIAFIIGRQLFIMNVPIGGKAILYKQILAGSIAFAIVFGLIYSIYSLIQKKK